MTKTAHTPGPWTFGADLGYADLNGRAIRNDDHYTIAVAIGDIDSLPVDANARLIAAAPDLLGALKFIMAFYEPGQRHLDTEAWKQAEAGARAAIAKATEGV